MSNKQTKTEYSERQQSIKLQWSLVITSCTEQYYVWLVSNIDWDCVFDILLQID